MNIFTLASTCPDCCAVHEWLRNFCDMFTTGTFWAGFYCGIVALICFVIIFEFKKE